MTTPAHDLSRLRIDRDSPPSGPRGPRRRVIVAVIAAVLLAAAAFVLVRRGSAVAVETVVATPLGGAGGSAQATGATAVTANGYVVARTRASVAAKVAGRLASLSVDEGTPVREGDVIARLESSEYQAAVGEARANLATARAVLAEAVAAEEQAERDAERVRRISAEGEGLIAPQELETAVSNAAQSAARARAAQARVDAAAASLRFAQASLENTVVRAPFTGTVLRKDAEVGEVVAPSVGGGLTRGAVVTMANLETLEVEVDVNEAYIGRVSHGQDARITLDAYPDTSFAGVVRQIVPTADRQRATVQVKVSITDRDPRILPEMGARVDFIAPEPAGGGAVAAGPPRFRLPASAVREMDGRTVVWLVRDGRLEPREVTAGPVSADYREVRSGLAGGERVLTGGIEAPEAGMRVKVPE
jgi:RND family efflux transporter MFP subunit